MTTEASGNTGIAGTTGNAETAPGRLPPSRRTLPAMLQLRAAAAPDRPLLRIGAHRWSASDAVAAASRRAGALADAGIAAGDRVALLCGNRIEFVELFLGCGWLGATLVPINTASMGPQIEYFLAQSEARLLVIDEADLPRLATAALANTALKDIWVLPRETSPTTAQAVDSVPETVALTPPSELAPGVQLRMLPPPGPEREAVGARPGDPLAILYTSGTTGPAKGVVCPHAQYYGWGVNSLEILGLRADDVLCTTLPLFHINALNTFAQALVAGCEVVYEPRFSASGFWPAMAQAGATVVYLLGAMVPILLAQPPGAAERAHRVRVGLGPGVPAAAGRAFAARTGVRLLEGYGSTETNFAIATTTDSPRDGVMGWLRPGFDARVADEDDAACADGEAGELLLRAHEPHAFASGYFRMPDKTVEAWRNLWFHTGDRVVREADGAFRFVDRIKDAIRRRGENISSFEVEQVLLMHPSVAACAVFPVRSELAEDEVMAALVARDGHAIEPSEVAAFCESRLPYFAVPRYLDLVGDLPRTENGKVQKFRLREQGVTARTWDRGPGRRVAPVRPGT